MTHDEARAEYGRLLPAFQAIQSDVIAGLRRAVDSTNVQLMSRIKSWESLNHTLGQLAVPTLAGVDDLVEISVTVPESTPIDDVSAEVRTALRKLADTFDGVGTASADSDGRMRHHTARVRSIGVEVQILTATEAARRIIDHHTRYHESSGVRGVPARRTRVLDEVIDEFEQLLEKPNVHEKKDVHAFLRRHDFILFPHPDVVTSEVSIGLGTEHRIDFLIRRPDGTYILVEIENPRAAAFTKSGDFAFPLNHALRQVEDWQDWIEANIQTVDRYFPGIRSPEAWVVLGRDRKLGADGRQRLARRNINMRGRVSLKTYDDLIRDARAYVRSLERLLGLDPST